MFSKQGFVLSLVSIACMVYVCEGLTFAAFNIKWLTPKKYDKALVHDNLRKILQLYDITLIQELRGDGLAVMNLIVDDLNKQKAGVTYNFAISEKVGRTSYKEQYAFLYRTDKTFSISEAYQYVDTDDTFEREPMIAIINDPSLYTQTFAIVGVHIKPDSVVSEMNKLHDVYTYVNETLGVPSVIFAGDFNADCRYLNSAKFNDLEFTKDKKFSWLIDSSQDTTVSTNTDCAYDRFIVTDDIKAEIKKGSVAILNYQEKLSLSYEDAKVVTDHYPISLELS